MDGAVVALEVVILSLLNVAVVYLAAFTYRLNWTGVLTVMVFASVVTASVGQWLLSRWMTALPQQSVRAVVSEGAAVLIVALASSLAVLIVLVQRYNLPMALGVSLMSGVLSAAVRRVMA